MMSCNVIEQCHAMCIPVVELTLCIPNELESTLELNCC